jgi:hypothetical protein
MAVKTTARIRVVKMAVRVCKNTAGEASGITRMMPHQLSARPLRLTNPKFTEIFI